MIPFFELRTQYLSIKTEIDSAVQKVLDSGYVILGDEVKKFEETFSSYIGKKYGIGVGSCTDALHLALVCAGIQQGDEVITVAHTAYETVSPIIFVNATPVFVDINDTMNIDPLSVESAITNKTKAIIPVHLYGNPVEMNPIMEIAEKYDLTVIEDCAQASGAEYHGKKVGAFGEFSCFSFYPTKNLGTYGDGGMILTNDEEDMKKLRMLRSSGQSDRYHHEIKGFTTRLDEIHAAILNVKLKYLDKWDDRRRYIAKMYSANLSKLIKPIETGKHVYYQYVIRDSKRDELREHLKNNGVETFIHYPIPLHQQKAYSDMGSYSLPITEETVKKIVSLPIYPELTNKNIMKIIEITNNFKK
jgi:dTDP-4-amino-4,6-dideoxygalactose transaminase